MTGSNAPGSGSIMTDWRPPARPDWVAQVNALGADIDLRSVVPLDGDSLIRAATAATGLDDFGPEDWIEPFRVFTASLDADADLNLTGRLRVRTEVLQLLKSRLEIEDEYRRHPEIDDEEIRQPIVIVGQGRSGTSFLTNLLAALPGNGAARHWEVLFPSPPPEAATYASDPRIETAERFISQWYRITPSLAAMHEFAAEIPIECCAIHGINFMSPTWMHAFGQVSRYDAFIAGNDPALALRYHKRVLKLLQWKNPRRHWVLKDIMYLDWLPALMAVYPDACVVWPHRDPVRALASVVSITGTLQWAHSDHPFKGESLGYIVDPHVSAARLDRAIAFIDDGGVPAAQIHNLFYRDLVADPLAEVAKLYAHFGFAFDGATRTAAEAYLQRHPRDARPRHRFGIGSDAAVAAARAAYARYQRRFSIEDE